MIKNIFYNSISFRGYKSIMVDTVKKAIEDEKLTIHCAYSGDVFTSSKKRRPSIEHIKPHTDGGENKDYNFLPVNRKTNSERGCTPLPEYIEVNPQVIENVKRTISEVARLKSENFDGKKWAKEAMKTFSEEAKTKIDVDLDSIDSTIYIENTIKKTNPKIEQIKEETTNPFQKQLEQVLKQLEKEESTL